MFGKNENKIPEPNILEQFHLLGMLYSQDKDEAKTHRKFISTFFPFKYSQHSILFFKRDRKEFAYGHMYAPKYIYPHTISFIARGTKYNTNCALTNYGNAPAFTQSNQKMGFVEYPGIDFAKEDNSEVPTNGYIKDMIELMIQLDAYDKEHKIKNMFGKPLGYPEPMMMYFEDQEIHDMRAFVLEFLDPEFMKQLLTPEVLTTILDVFLNSKK